MNENQKGQRRVDRYATDKRFGKRISGSERAKGNSRDTKADKARAKGEKQSAKARAKDAKQAAKARAKEEKKAAKASARAKPQVTMTAPPSGKRSGAGGTGGGRKKRKRRLIASPFFWIGVVVIIALAAGGAFLALKVRAQSASSSELAEAMTTDAGSDAQTTTGAIPLASATDQIIASMTLEEKVGQMMMVGFDGGEAGPQISSAIKDRHIGGVILYGRNISSHEQVAALDTALQGITVQAKQPAKLMIAIDQEGGATRRFTDIGPYYSEPMIGDMTGGAGAAAAQQQASSAARDLKKLGINTNLAPDADVSNGWGSVMDGRSYGPDSSVVTELVGKSVVGYNNATTISCPKHFPGHGSADGDSEKSLPTVDLSLDALNQSELPPFQEAIKQGAPMIMVGHLSVPALDATGTPASLSHPVVTDLLRKQLGFTGVIITDDLEMGAISGSMSVADAAVAAVAAGNDIVMLAQTAANQNAAYDAIVAAVKSGKLKEDDINKSVARIIDMKKKYRLEVQ